MKKYDILLKSINLLYREKQLKLDDVSNDLVISTIRSMKTKYNKHSIFGGGEEVLNNLKNYVEELATSASDSIELESILQSVKVILNGFKDLYSVFEESLRTEISEAKLKSSVTAMRRMLKNFHREMEIADLVSRAHYYFNNQHQFGVKSTNDFLEELVTKLEALELSTRYKDPAIVNEVDLGDDVTLSEIAKEVKDEGNSLGILKTGWQSLNNMIQGGFRRGELAVIGALQHGYKSSLLVSIFIQIIIYNKPTLKDSSKKPLLLFYSMEDPLKNIFSFIYRYFYYDEFGKLPNMTSIKKEELSSYVRAKLSKNGFHVKFARIDPSEWTYKSLFSNVLNFEAEGYEIIACFVDYLDMIPKTGCTGNGTAGSDIQDMYKRVRNFMSARGILFVTPHQLSTEAKGLWKQGLKGPVLLNETANKGYYKGSRSIDQEFDLEIQIDRFKHNNKWYLAFKRGKHRLPTIVDEELLLACLPYPPKAPIMPDIDKKDSAYYPDKTEGSDEFNF